MSYVKSNSNNIYYEVEERSNIKLFYIAGHRNVLGNPPETLISDFCLKNNYSLVKFDYSGWGKSEGKEQQEGYLQDWFEDALSVFEKTVNKEDKVILVGFSMGGLIALMLGMLAKEQIKGIFGISSGGGPEFNQQLMEIYGSTNLNVLNKNDFELGLSDGGVKVLSKMKYDFPLKYIHSKDDPWVSLQSLKETIENIDADIELEVIAGQEHNPKTAELFKPVAKSLKDFIRSL